MFPFAEESQTPCHDRMARAQEHIRTLIDRGVRSPAQRLELAGWQRAWVMAWRECAPAA